MNHNRPFTHPHEEFLRTLYAGQPARNRKLRNGLRLVVVMMVLAAAIVFAILKF